MNNKRTRNLFTAALFGVLVLAGTMTHAADPLPSWKDGKAKQSIIEFVAKVTKAGSTDFVPVPERIATFDNDGTLWAEQPMYFQLRFALDRVKALAPQHPEWKKKQPFKNLLSTPKEEKVPVTEQELMEVIMVTHAGMTTEEFEQIVKDWLATARHPKTGKLYTEMVYQPMLELLAYLRAIGRRPIAAFGNSDGDLQMLQYTAAGSGPRFCLYVHHTDAAREWAYDRKSHIGKLDKGLDEAASKGWTVVSMKDDWKQVFAFENH